jgi:uncharacterized membrane protein
MSHALHNAQEEKRRFLGFPLDGFGLFTSLLLALAAAFLTFFATTTLAIFGLLVWNVVGRHSINFADSYRVVGFPAGLLALAIAGGVFGSLWIKSRMRS